MRISDAALSVLLLLSGVALVAVSWSFPDLPGQDYGASTFPLAIGAGLLALGVAGAISAFRAERETAVRFEGWGLDPGSWLRVMVLLALVVGYILLSPLFGFLLTSGALLFGLLMTFRAPLLVSAVTTPVAIAAVWWVFDGLLRVPLPTMNLSGGY